MLTAFQERLVGFGTAAMWVLVVTAIAVPSATPLSAGVIDWSPGTVSGFTDILFLSVHVDDDDDLSNNGTVIDLFSSGFDDVVNSSGAFHTTFYRFAPQAAGSTDAAWVLQLSKSGVDATFASATNAFAVQSWFSKMTSTGSGDLREYRFTLDSPTEVTLSVTTDNTGHTVDTSQGWVWAELFAVPNYTTNLFPNFQDLPSGVLTETKLLPPGTYSFWTGLNAAASDLIGAGATCNVTSTVTLRFGPPVAVDGPPSGSLAARVALTPNPSRGNAIISLIIPEASDVDVALYDVNGRRIESIKHAHMEAGPTSFAWGAAQPVSGVYFVRLHSKTFMTTSRVVFLR